MYGQDYNYMIEAFFAVPFLWCNVPVEYALPIVTNILAIAPFISWAFWFKRKKRNLAAVFLLAIPLLLPISYALITSMPRGFINGLAFFALWPWIENVQRAGLRYALCGALLAGAIVTNANVIFVAVLLGGLAFFQSTKKVQFIMFILLGASIPALLHLGAKTWVSNRPDEILHTAWGLEWTSDYFMQAVSVLPISHFKGVIPFTETYAHLMWFLFPALCIYAFVKKKYSLAILLGIICAGVIISFGINKVNDGTSNIFYPASRMFLALPLVLGITLAAFLDDRYVKQISLGLIVIAGVFTSVQLLGIRETISTEVLSAESIPLKIEQIGSLKVKTAELRAFAITNSITYFAGAGYPMMYGEQQNLFHVGECWFDDFPKCALPEYERRRWVSDAFLPLKTKTTAWIGGDDWQWSRINSNGPPVNVFDVAGMKVYIVRSDSLTNRQVLLLHGKQSAIGE